MQPHGIDIGISHAFGLEWQRYRRDEALAISMPRNEAHVIRHFQERMPYGLFVPEVPTS